MDKRVLRETDLLAFEIALRETDISSVMCSYNKINGDWACENQYLLNDFLKGAAGFKGFVVSIGEARTAPPRQYRRGWTWSSPAPPISATS